MFEFSNTQSLLRRRTGAFGVAMVLGLFVISPAEASTISDGFEDLDRDNNGTTDDGSSAAVGSPNGFAWYRYDSTSRPDLTTGDDSAGIGSGNALFVSADSSNREFMANLGQSVSLGAATGSTVSLSLDVRFNNAGGAAPNDGTFRFGLFQDTNGNLANAVGGWGASDGDFDNSVTGAQVGDRGVWGRTATGTTAAANNSARVIVEGSADAILGGTGGDGRSFGGNQDFLVLSDADDVYRLTLVITRTDDGMEVSYTADNLTSAADDAFTIGDDVDASSGDPRDFVVSSFDFIAITSSSANDYVIDNVVVTSTGIPEPASLCLLGLGVLFVGGRRR